MTTKRRTSTGTVSKGRHEHQCRICSHPKRDEIEQAFIAWVSPAHIAKKYSVSRDGVYRHAHVFGLMDKRRRNVRAALERIIERAGMSMLQPQLWLLRFRRTARSMRWASGLNEVNT